MICLYPLSVDKQTGQTVAYRIGGPYDMEPLKVSEYKVSEMPPEENWIALLKDRIAAQLQYGLFSMMQQRYNPASK